MQSTKVGAHPGARPLTLPQLKPSLAPQLQCLDSTRWSSSEDAGGAARRGPLHLRPGRLSRATNPGAQSSQRVTAQNDRTAVVTRFTETVTETETAVVSIIPSWTARWWPVMLTTDLDPKRPHKVDLLGLSLVVWSDSKGQWHCMEDSCPHRLAPLSEGRIEGDELMCSYHGWRFNRTGQCTQIPQLEYDPKAHQSACNSQRSCAKAYPAMAKHGLLWIWPEGDIESAIQAAATEPGLGLPAKTYETSEWFIRELPMRFDTLCENLLDPTHVPFSHHGLGPLNRNNPWICKVWDGASLSEVTEEGFTMNARNGSELQFIAPCNVRYSYQPPPGSKMPPGSGPKFFVVPTKPGWSKIVWEQQKPKLPLGLSKVPYITQLLKAFFHVSFRNTLLDGDTYFVHVAERRLPVSKGIGMATASKVHYMPAPGDGAVVGLRKWLQLVEGTVPTCKPEDEAHMPAVMPPEQALDRYSQHTQFCRDCQAGLTLVSRLRTLAAALGAIAAIAAVACGVAAAVVPSLAQVTPVNAWPVGLVSAAVCSLCVWMYGMLTTIRQKFYYEEYVHALKD